jgi:hypothetical protein
MGYMELYCTVTNHLSYFNMHPHNILHYDPCKIFNAYTLTKTNTSPILKEKTKHLSLNFNVREIFCGCGWWYHLKEPVPLSLTHENKPHYYISHKQVKLTHSHNYTFLSQSHAPDYNHCKHRPTFTQTLKDCFKLLLLWPVSNIVILYGLVNFQSCKWHLKTNRNTF